ncbi:serine hydrolase domain-containing protein, partial [Bacteroidota bacterium]
GQNDVKREKFIKEVQIKLDSLREWSGFPGATLAFNLNDGSLLKFATGLSDLDKNIKMKPDDIMFSGSNGKTFVSAVLMQLYEEKKIDFDKKISYYLGEESWFDSLPNSSELTVKMLLTHTGGLPRYVMKQEFWEEQNSNPDKVWKPAELLSFVFNDNPVHEAGKGWSYSDTDYIVLGMIIEKICNNTYYNELTNRILKPFNLKSTYPSDSRKIKGLIPGYKGEGSFGLPEKPLINGQFVINPQFEWCGGGLVSNSPDLARWAKILYEANVFSRSTLEELLQPHDFRTGQPAEMGYGYGVFVFNTAMGKIYTHEGMFPGYETSMQYIPELKSSLALQINTDASSGKLKKRIQQILSEFIPLLKEYLGK